MKLWFDGLKGRRLVASGTDEQFLFKAIHSDLKQNYPHFKSYYQRVWVSNGEKWVDVGDHCSFYVITLEEGETWQKDTV